MTHIELSLSPLTPSNAVDPLASWIGSVSVAEEACLVIDIDGIIVATSPCCPALLGWTDSINGQNLLDPDVLQLIDFTAAGNELGEAEREQIPPLLALSSGRPARGLMRIRGTSGENPHTLDAVATALHHRGAVVGALSFFATV